MFLDLVNVDHLNEVFHAPQRIRKAHDKKIYDETRMTTPPGIKRGGDTGYQGTAMEIPHKKPKGKALTPEQKETNRAFSSKRVKVEHGIGA
ncbi:MAG: transposase family protein, partial [Pseudomonadota bacterium]